MAPSIRVSRQQMDVLVLTPALPHARTQLPLDRGPLNRWPVKNEVREPSESPADCRPITGNNRTSYEEGIALMGGNGGVGHWNSLDETQQRRIHVRIL
ncbi:hypothetical protein EVAR_7024_1 [Eumeta japonica]|uniref:Uncharacterized protein n=1 Tax=Eumeta variegata TaxID=151549 RepID=A0A4C1TGT0_EUMVA|nr:hypothetical protein EVAR_7024_1 [Eumeta japonica]